MQTINKSAHTLEEWKYCRPADLTKALPIYGNQWKFCPKCKCRATGKEGIYQLSHWAKDHIDGYGQQSTITGTITSELSANVSEIDKNEIKNVYKIYKMNWKIKITNLK